MGFATFEDHFARTFGRTTAALWRFTITPEMLHVKMHAPHDGVPPVMYVALKLPVDSMTCHGRSPLRMFPIWLGSSSIGPHISIVYNAIMPNEEEAQWQLFWEVQLRMRRWLQGPTSMIVNQVGIKCLKLSRACQLHSQLRLARAEAILHMGLQELGEGRGDPLTWDDMHITFMPWAVYS